MLQCVRSLHNATHKYNMQWEPEEDPPSSNLLAVGSDSRRRMTSRATLLNLLKSTKQKVGVAPHCMQELRHEVEEHGYGKH